MEKSKRIEWIDYTKAFACLLVTIGHLLMSLRAIDKYSLITEFIIWFIYLFHMPLFMCMSGLLYHKRTQINSIEDYKTFIYKKTINLVVPYITFYSITMILNMLFSSSVNKPKGINEWIGILNDPISPYWFIYALLSIFIFVPIIEHFFKHNKNVIMLFFIVIKFISIYWIPNLYFIKSVMKYGIYFYLGAYINYENNNKTPFNSFILLLFYFITAALIYTNKSEINNHYLEVLKIGFAVVGTVITIYIFKMIRYSIFLDTFKEYTFQIFLMHTIFAAGARILMYKIGINNYFIHVIIGFSISVYVPVMVSIISNKLRYTNFFFYPLKTIEECKNK